MGGATIASNHFFPNGKRQIATEALYAADKVVRGIGSDNHRGRICPLSG